MKLRFIKNTFTKPKPRDMLLKKVVENVKNSTPNQQQVNYMLLILPYLLQCQGKEQFSDFMAAMMRLQDIGAEYYNAINPDHPLEIELALNNWKPFDDGSNDGIAPFEDEEDCKTFNQY